MKILTSPIEFTWTRGYDVTIEGERIYLLLQSSQVFSYRPANDMEALLTAVQRIRVGDDIPGFVRDWGTLGFTHDAASDQDTHISHPSAFASDKVSEFLNFAEWVRQIVSVKELVDRFADGNQNVDALDERAAAWLAGLSDEKRHLLGVYIPLDELQERYSRGGWAGDSFAHHVALTALSTARQNFSDRSRRNIWIGLKTHSYSTDKPEGQPGIHFDSLATFIQFVLLRQEGTVVPVRCADPKCQMLFFPRRKNQKYCPRLPGQSRSACENRHMTETRRKRAKARRLHARGQSIREISASLNVHIRDVEEWLKQDKEGS